MTIRPQALGKFLSLGERKLYVRGVTYGPFRPEADGCEYHTLAVVERDFREMAAQGMNAVRVYTVPPRWLLDAAQAQGLLVMVGLPWEQHVAFLDDPAAPRRIEGAVREGVRACAGHPAVLCYAVGNEIPAPIVRWHGNRRVQRFLERLYDAAKQEDPGALVTYVNYPSTEYLDLPFLDLVGFNVYLESPDRLRAYLGRLQNLAGDRPMLLAEIGLDSVRKGVEVQAETLRGLVRSAYDAGVAGSLVFSWTDEWHRGGQDIADWGFGLTDTSRAPKPSLAAVRECFAHLPFDGQLRWPRFSVVVCSYNGSRTIRDCLEGLKRVEYPDFEVIVIDDGSTDSTALIASGYPVRLVSTENHGLSAARNLGLTLAQGEIVAYIDDDARPDPHWLHYLAEAFRDERHAGVGGPNLVPPEDGFVAQCVYQAPGGPTHVLLTDDVAEHIPGCNMAFRRDCLRAVGGFDEYFRIAGDDVDVCWKLQQRGWTLGFHPAALVWHHRRNSVKAYWRQQKNYGSAEAILERKWPGKYNATGHVTWSGRIYGGGVLRLFGGRQRIYHGVWGGALFQSVYQLAPGILSSLPLMPEWYLMTAVLAVLSIGGVFWWALRWAAALAGAMALATVASAMFDVAQRPVFARSAERRRRHWLTLLLTLMQPAARLWGRLDLGLTPWRSRHLCGFTLPRPRSHTVWSEKWRSAEGRLTDLESGLRSQGAAFARGGEFDRWDLQVRGGMLGAARMRMAIEEHGEGKQLVRFRMWPVLSGRGATAMLLFTGLSAVARIEHRWGVCLALALPAVALAARAFVECGHALATVRVTVSAWKGGSPRSGKTSQELPAVQEPAIPSERADTA